MNIINDDIKHHINEYNIILVGTNIYQTMSNGFQRYVRLNYPYVFEKNLQTKYADEKKMGTILVCKEDGNPTFILCFIDNGKSIFTKGKEHEYLSYEALEMCLEKVRILYGDKSICSTIIGSSKFDGSGDKEKLIKIITSKLPNITLFDYEQKSRAEEMTTILKEENELKKTNLEEYYKAVKKRKEEAEKRFNKNKRARY